MLKLVLIMALLQSTSIQSSNTVALVFGPYPVVVEIVTVQRAEKEYEELRAVLETRQLTEQEYRRFTALTLALGTRPTTRRIFCTDTPARCETMRGIRLPTQMFDPSNP